MKVGYARCSTSEQTVEPQLIRLREAGCEKFFIDEGVSGAQASRPDWDRCLEFVRPGDTLVAVKLDRFGRSLKHLLDVVELLSVKGVGLVCLDQGMIDTTTPTGRLVFGILACISEFEKDLIRSRTMDGLAAARAKGHMGGRPVSYGPEQAQACRALKAAGSMTVTEIASAVGVSKRTAYRILADEPAA